MTDYLKILEDYVARRDNDVEEALVKQQELFTNLIPDITNIIMLSRYMYKHHIDLPKVETKKAVYLYVDFILQRNPAIIMENNKPHMCNIAFCVNSDGHYWACFTNQPQYEIPMKPEEELVFLKMFNEKFIKYKAKFFNYVMSFDGKVS